jgi:hypothetical protein
MMHGKLVHLHSMMHGKLVHLHGIICMIVAPLGIFLLADFGQRWQGESVERGEPTTAQRSGPPTAPPAVWVSLLVENHQILHRVRMLWRRGKVPYRPLVPEHLNVDKLSAEEMIEYELPNTHFDWLVEPSESPTARREGIQAIVNNLWDIAARWTRSRGEWCDFQLLGFDDDGEELFAVGRRLKIEDEPDLLDGEDGAQAPSSPRSSVPPPPPPSATLSPGWRELHKAHTSELEQIIDYTKTDRDDAVARSRQTLDDNQRLWKQVHEASQTANQVLRETVAYEREQVERAKDQSSGRLKVQAHALTEMERTHRFGQALDFLKYGWDSAMANLVPLANLYVETLTGQRAPKDFPEFRRAQQAMAYLVLDLTPTQLDMMFDKDRKAAGAFLGRLDHGASMKVERDALDHVAPVVRILRSERFRDLTRPEQQLAARFIIGRLANLRMVEYGEDEAEDGAQAE